MQLVCPSCGKSIPAQDVSIELAIAKCGGCNDVFNISDQIAVGTVAASYPVGMPKRFAVENWGPELVITRRWFTHAVWFLIFFCTFWDGFLVVWYTAGIRALVNGQGGGMEWFMLLFPVFHVAVGVWLTYYLL